MKDPKVLKAAQDAVIGNRAALQAAVAEFDSEIMDLQQQRKMWADALASADSILMAVGAPPTS